MTEQEEYEAAVTENQLLKDNLYDEVEDKKRDLNNLKEGILRKHGWHHSCTFPGSFWLWVKEVKGETIATTMDVALNIEANMVEYKN